MGFGGHESHAVEVGGVAEEKFGAVVVQGDALEGGRRGRERGGEVAQTGFGREGDIQVARSGDRAGVTEQFDADGRDALSLRVQDGPSSDAREMAVSRSFCVLILKKLNISGSISRTSSSEK